MNNKLSVVSRILVGFAAGALVAVFFLPAWRIDLFAPQYPEGLVMNIWINDITGDVDVINGLNHYIGMKHITVDMFPEFKYLPYVFGFLMMLGFIVAIAGRRMLLFVYVALLIIGGALAMYDFHLWGYDYGHNLDPMAPIQVEGLSYQPPLIGHKRLLNFDAYSFPHVGGWIAIAAGLLAAGVWVTEWYLNRKKVTIRKKVKNVIPGFAIFSMTMSFFSSCTSGPQPFEPGKDNCYACKMAISDTRFGGELITKKGKVYKFDDLHCLAGFMQSKAVGEDEIAQTLTINFDKPNSFVDVDNAVFLKGEGVKSPMGSNTAGFADKEDALRVQETMKGEVTDWTTLFNNLK